MESRQQQKPDYVLADSVQPDQRIFAIFKVIKVEEKVTEINNGKAKFIVSLGDTSGTLNMFLKEDNYIKICQENPFVEVLNAHARFYKGFIQLEMDRWGIIRPCSDVALCQQQTDPVNEANDLSAVEYELVPSAETQKGSKPSEEQSKKPRNKPSDSKLEESKPDESQTANRGGQKKRGGRGRGRGGKPNAQVEPIAEVVNETE